MDAFAEIGIIFKVFFDLEKQISLNAKNQKQVQKEKLYNVPCSWCGRDIIMTYQPITTQRCSRKCEEEVRIYYENKRYR